MKRLKYLAMAALVAFAACDEGNEVVTTPPPVTGSISGTVTIDGSGASGITVTLSNGSTQSTDASGRYSFTDVLAGSYTVSISGTPSDATFGSSSAGVLIQTSGQVAVADFSGNYIKTATIFGQVSVGGTGIPGVTVSISGMASVTGTTDANGQYSFGGLRAGNYTVQISGYDNSQYEFTATSQSVSLNVGQAAPANFAGTRRATAQIIGTVTLNNNAAAGITVTLSTGASATTDAQGRYAFGNLLPGTYQVTISNLPADAVFGSTTASLTVTSSGQVRSQDFAGQYVGTARIGGLVSVEGRALGNVTVTIAGITNCTTTTDANGRYECGGLRAGSYTVTISGYDTTANNFAATSQNVTLTSGQVATADFSGTIPRTSSVTGSIFIDENANNDTFDTQLEPRITGSTGVTVSLTGGDVATTATTTVAADGTYSFTNLPAGNYQVTLSTTGATGMGAYTFGGTSTSVLLAPQNNNAVAIGGTQVVNWPFNITTQTVTVQAFLGADENASGIPAASRPASRVTPLAGVSFNLYNTYANAVAAGACTLANGCLGTATTAANGSASVSFLRSNDSSPQASVDNIVFAARTALPAEHVGNGEAIIEIKYDPVSATFTALDAFDALNTRITMSVVGQESDGDKLNGWKMSMWIGDTANVASQTKNTTATTGLVTFTDATLTLPTTYWVRLDRGSNNTAQPVSLPFTTTATASGATNPAGEWLRIVHDGTRAAGTTVNLGTQNVRYNNAYVLAGVFHEKDNTVGYSTTADDLVGANRLRGVISATSGGTQIINVGDATVGGLFTQTAPAFPAGVTLPAPSTGTTSATYFFRTAQSAIQPNAANVTVLGNSGTYNTEVSFTLDGSDSLLVLNTIGGTAAAPRTFAYKFNNTQISGNIIAEDLGADGTINTADDFLVGGITVTLTPAATNLVSSMYTTKTATTASAGATRGQYVFTGLLEGTYTVTVADVAGTWVHRYNRNFGATSTTEVNSATRTLSGEGDIDAAGFTPRFMNTNIRGVVANDRDGDQNTIDNNEALAGATIQLLEDINGDGDVADAGESTVIATATSDATGAYSFSGVPAGFYAIRGPALVGSATVLVRINADGTKQRDRIGPSIRTRAGAPNLGSTTPANTNQLPFWNYNGSTISDYGLDTNFTFLFNNTTIVGRATLAGGAAVANMTVTVRRCQTSAGSTSPPSAGNCLTYTPGVQVNLVTDASGNFTATNLEEGVYEVTPNPVTAGLTGSTPASMLFRLVDNADIETGPAFIIN